MLIAFKTVVQRKQKTNSQMFLSISKWDFYYSFSKKTLYFYVFKKSWQYVFRIKKIGKPQKNCLILILYNKRSFNFFTNLSIKPICLKFIFSCPNFKITYFVLHAYQYKERKRVLLRFPIFLGGFGSVPTSQKYLDHSNWVTFQIANILSNKHLIISLLGSILSICIL